MDGSSLEVAKWENIVEREVKEQIRRESELAAMYQTRNSVEQRTPPTSGPYLDSNDVPPPACRRLEPRTGPSQSAADDDDDEGRRRAVISSSPAIHSDSRQHSDTYSGNTTEDSPDLRYSSPGEKLVYREMMEQQAREMELRQHWKQVYGEYIAPPSDDRFHDHELAPEIHNSRRSTTHNPYDSHNDGVLSSEYYPTPLAARTVTGSRNTETFEDDQVSVTSSGTSTSSRNVSRSASGSERGRHGGRDRERTGKAVQRQSTDSVVMRRRRSRNEAEHRVEGEVIEAMRRERELRQMRESLKRLDLRH